MNLLPFALSLLLPMRALAALELASPEPVVLRTPGLMDPTYSWMSAGAGGRLAIRNIKEIWVWAAGSSRIEKVINSEAAGKYVGLAPDGRFAAGGSRILKKKRFHSLLQPEAAVWDVDRDQEVAKVSGSADAIMSADGTKAAFFNSTTPLSLGDDTVRLRDMRTGKLSTVWNGPGKCLETGSAFQPFRCEGVAAAALSSSGSRVLISRQQKGGFNKENTVIVVDGNTGKKLRGYADCDSVMEQEWAGASAAAYSADGRFLAYACPKGTWVAGGVIVREADTSALLWKSTEVVQSLAFAPDGSTLVGVRGTEGPLAAWDVATGRTEPPPTPADAGQATFATDGSFLFVGLAGQAEVLAYRLKGHPTPPLAVIPPAPHAEAIENVDTPPLAKTKIDPDALAVVIGVERYRQGGIPPVEFAASDAKTVAAYLTQSMGFDAKNVILLADEQATQADLKKYLGPWLENRATEKSRVFVYYAGHGSPDPKSGDSYLMPYEGDPTYIQITGYPLKELYKTLGALPTKNVLVVLDSCFSGAGQRSLIAAGARPLVNVKAVEPWGSTVVLAAAAGDQISGSYPEGRHGLLTYFLLKGLRGPPTRTRTAA
jgi:WD40 repeat protein